MDRKALTILIIFVIISIVGFYTLAKSTMNLHEANKNKIEDINITPTSKFFSVSYDGVPEINISKYTLKIDGLVKTPLNLSYNDIVSMEEKSKTETLTCIALISGKAVWTGILLKDILNRAGIKNSATEVVFYAADGYSSSIPLQNAYKDNVILATKMNGEALTPKHGFPIRLVYPGYYGYKWVKWINRIELVDYDFKGYWERQGYSDEAKIEP